MKKNLLAAVLMACLSMMVFAGCSSEATGSANSGETVDVVEETMTEPEPEKYLTIDAYGGYGMLSAVMEDGSDQETGSWSFVLTEGMTIGDILKAEGIQSIEVKVDNWSDEVVEDEASTETEEEIAETETISETDETDADTEPAEVEGFEGWIEYKVYTTYDEEGFTTDTYEKVSGDTYYTTEELLAKPAPDYSVLYVAKWADVSVDEYYKLYELVDDGLDLYLSIYANGGSIWCGEEEPYEIGLSVNSIETGQTFGLMMGSDSPITSVEMAGYTFAGWNVYTGETVEWVEEEVTDLDDTMICLEFGDYGYALIHNYKLVGENITTEELYDTVCEGTEYVALASWE